MVKEDAIYARQSADKIDSISIESQIEFCKYETRGGAYRIYQDKGYSGKSTDRPEFQKMLAAIRNAQIKRVICYKLDRCSRSILDFANLMEEFQKYQVEFVSCTEKFDTSSPMGRAMLNICIVFAQLERETIQQRVLDAYHSRSKHGFFMGGRIPFGFTTESFHLDGKKTSRYVMVDEECRILEFMYSVYEKPDSSLGDVVKALHEAGISHPRKADGKWIRSHIGRMLHNPVYVKSDLAIYQFFRENGVIIHNPPEDFIGTNGCYLYSGQERTHPNYRLDGHHLVLAPHKGFIPSDVWLRCRKKSKFAGQAMKQNKVKNTWLAGKLKCAKCGYALVIKKSTKPSGKEFRYIVCSESMETEKRCPGVRGLKADPVEELVFREISKKLKNFSTLTAPQQIRSDPQILQLKIRLAKLDERIETVTKNAMEASGSLIKYLSEKVAELDRERNECAARLHKLQTDASAASIDNSKITNCISKWEELTLQDKILVTDALIEKILLTEGEITIKWKTDSG